MLLFVYFYVGPRKALRAVNLVTIIWHTVPGALGMKRVLENHQRSFTMPNRPYLRGGRAALKHRCRPNDPALS